ncbi:MAG: TetR family transcriptional regulator [Streptosporangiaceae bacterium]|jgi:AcrR family transcriptional regulator
MRGPGRPPRDSGTRAAIIDAARAVFLEHGYNEATIRSVARRAEVDPALIYHYFTDKPTLYVSTLDLPADPRAIMKEVQLSTASPGARLVDRFLAQWETGPGVPGQSFVTMAQAISSSPQAARSLREFLMDRVWSPRAEEGEDARWRMVLISSQLMGLAWSRYIMRVEPLASAPRHEVAERLGPALERLMFGARPPGDVDPGRWPAPVERDRA